MEGLGRMAMRDAKRLRACATAPVAVLWAHRLGWGRLRHDLMALEAIVLGTLGETIWSGVD